VGTNIYNYQFNSVIRGDAGGVQHQRFVFNQGYPDGPCLVFTENYTVVNGVYKHYSSSVTECK
jgi:hypothetical protein